MREEKHGIEGYHVLDEMMPADFEEPIIYIEDREASWNYFIDDIKKAKKDIHIDMPDVIDDNDDEIAELINILELKRKEGVEICIRLSDDIDLPEGLLEYTKIFEYITNPLTIIDKKTVWFGHPLYAADFISEGEILDTEYFPCIRFTGRQTARLIKAFLEI